MNYVIIGNSAAAVGAVEGIRKIDPAGNITVISSEPYHTYSRPLISYYLAGQVEENKMYYRPQDFYNNNKVDLVTEMVMSIDPVNKTVDLSDGTRLNYDRLLLATGGKPLLPSIEGLDKKGVFNFHTWTDVKEIDAWIPRSKKAVVMGAGLSGLKAVEALVSRGLDITLAVRSRVLRSILDQEGSELVHQVLIEKGVHLVFGSDLEEVIGGEEVKGVKLSNGQEVECDLLVVAMGVEPNKELAFRADLSVDRGVLVDEDMSTSAPWIYAAGDVAEGIYALTGKRRVIPILPRAYRQGEIAGINMAGGDERYTRDFPMNSLGFFGYYITTAGFSSAEEANGWEELTQLDRKNKSYRKLIIRDNKLVGFIAMKEIDRTGMLVSLINEDIDISSFRDKLLDTTGGYADWPGELRRERLRERGEAL